MSNSSPDLGDLTSKIRNHSDGLISAVADDKDIEGVKVAQVKISKEAKRLLDYVSALKELSNFLGEAVEVDWKDATAKLAKAKKWLDDDLVSWNANELIELADSLIKLTEEVKSRLETKWRTVYQRIVRIRTFVNFIGSADAADFSRKSRMYVEDSSSSTMIESIDFLKKAELFVKDGVADEEVQKFLEGSASVDGSPLSSLAIDSVKDWISQDDRAEKFRIRFKDIGA